MVLLSKRVGWWLSTGVLAVQPLLPAAIIFSILIGQPPLWLSWFLAVLPLGISFWRRGYILPRTPFDIPIVLFVLGTVVGVVVSPDKAVSLEALHTSLACVLIYYGIVSNSRAGKYYWFATGGAFCLVVLVLSVWYFGGGNGRHLFFNEWAFRLAQMLPDIGSSILNGQSLAAALAVIIPVVLAIAVFHSYRWIRVSALSISLVFLALLVLVASGNGWISAAIGILIVALCWRFWTGSVLLPALGLGSWAVVALYHRVSWLPEVFSVKSFLNRVDLWRETMGLLKSHPLTGCGLGTWLELYAARHPGVDITTVTHVHNSYLQLYYDTGVLGLLAVTLAAFILGILAWRMFRASRKSYWYGVGVGLVAGVLAGGADAFVETTFMGTLVWSPTSYHYIAIPMLWIWAGLLVVVYQHLRSEKEVIPVSEKSLFWRILLREL